MDKTDIDKTDISIDVPQGSEVSYNYAAFNEMPIGKTLEDLKMGERDEWLFTEPIHQGQKWMVIDFVHNANIVRKQAREDPSNIGLMVDIAFGEYIPIKVVMQRQIVIKLPFEDFED